MLLQHYVATLKVMRMVAGRTAMQMGDGDFKVH